jgi:hypothetical protein
MLETASAAVTRFTVRTTFLAHYQIHQVGSRLHLERAAVTQVFRDITVLLLLSTKAFSSDSVQPGPHVRFVLFMEMAK